MMELVTFVVLIGIVLVALFLVVKTVQSVTKIAVTMALVGFIVMLGIMIAFSLGLGDNATLTVMKEKAGNIIAPVGKAMGMISTARNTIDETEKKIDALTRKQNLTKD